LGRKSNPKEASIHLSFDFHFHSQNEIKQQRQKSSGIREERSWSEQRSKPNHKPNGSISKKKEESRNIPNQFPEEHLKPQLNRLHHQRESTVREAKGKRFSRSTVNDAGA
jgi:hypothetical protein